ncbi:MAG: Crp/Fnr family transcriptional regulator [Alphaproteobacteria bacterium]|jgi:CRP-like cAMP-binding protein|nr:Crp/Fnr family transcriptional regulator [Alphaproteobacteria bacterium]MDP6515551.1 Crp/Fnr family transcriptional regulator [Alphaproteobacteria bacterium]
MAISVSIGTQEARHQGRHGSDLGTGGNDGLQDRLGLPPIDFLPAPCSRNVGTCALCPVHEHAFCQPLSGKGLDILEGFKYGDSVFPAGSDVYSEDEVWTDVYTIVEGWVILYKLLEDGRRQITQIALPGDFIGFQPDVSGCMDHSAEALSETRLCVFPRASLYSIFSARPELAIRLNWMFGREVAEACERLTSLGRRSARERIAYFLLELFHRVRLRQPKRADRDMSLPLTQEHIGDSLGLTAVHVNRMLRELRDEGLVKIRRRTLSVLDPDRLAEIAEFQTEMFVSTH